MKIRKSFLGIVIIFILLFGTVPNLPLSNSQTTEILTDNSVSEQQTYGLEPIIITSPISPDTKSKKIDPELKFDLSLKMKIDDMINAGETRDYNVIILVKKEPENNLDSKSVAKKNKDLLEEVLKTHNSKKVRKAEILSFVTASVPLNELRKLADNDEVIKIGDGEQKVESELNISRPSIFADDLTFNGTGITVSVIDTAIRQFHSDMPNGTKIVNQVTCSNTGCTNGVSTPDDPHGTHVAGIIAGFGNVDSNLRGIATESLLLNAVHSGNATAFAHALDWSLQNGAKVINQSQGMPRTSPCTNDIENLIVDEAVDEGAIFVKSAGNIGDQFGDHSITDPGCGYNVIAVGNMNDHNNSTRTDDVIHETSSLGPANDEIRLKPEIVAPGTLINSTDLTTDYSDHYDIFEVTGTSFAAPHVSGTAALILQAQPQYSPLEVKSALLLGADWNPTNAASVSSTSAEYENGGSDDVTLNTYGFGYLNASKSLTYANSGKNIAFDSISQDENITYSFSAIQGEQIKVILSWLRHPGGTIINPGDPTVSNLDFTIKKPDGSTITSDSDFQNNEFAVFNAPTTGGYTITISAPFVTSAIDYSEPFTLGSTHFLENGDYRVKQGTFVKAIASTTPQLVRPTSDISIGGWTITPLYQKINESTPDDATLVTSPSGTAPQFEVEIGNPTDPEVSTGHIIKFRAKSSSGSGSAEQANAILFQGTTQIAQTGLKNLSRTAFTQYSYTLSAAEANSITDYNNLSIRITTSKANTEVIQVSWIEFEIPASPAVQTISGLGFQPKSLILFTTGQTAEGTTDGYKFSIGYSNGTASRSIGVASDDNAASSNAGRAFGAKVLKIIGTGTPTISAEADLVSFDSDSFTIKWTTNDSIPSIIRYVVLGGDGLKNATVSSFAAPITTGNQNVVVGFRPDFLMFMHAASTTETSLAANAYLSYGFASSSFQRGALAIASEDGRGTMDTWNYQRINRAIVTLDETTGAIDAESDLVSLNSDGFTLNWIDAPAAVDRIYYLALKGGGYGVGSFDTTTGNGNPVNTFPNPVTFPKGVILTSTNNYADVIVYPNNRLSFGVSDGITEGSTWTGDQDNAANSITARSSTNSKIIRFATEAATGSSSVITAEADLLPFDSQNFSLNWTTSDTVPEQVIYVVFGNSDLTSGLVGHWKLDESSGLVAIDSSGNNGTGTLNNGPVWASGSSCKINGCLSFDGVDDNVSIPDSTPLDGMSELTISAWVKRNIIDTNRYWIVGKSIQPLTFDKGSYDIYLRNDELHTRVFLPSFSCDGGMQIQNDTANFHHVVLRYKNAKTFAFADGVPQDTGCPAETGSIRNSSYPVTFAWPSNVTSGPLPGIIDDVRIYNRGLSDAEIQRLYQMGN